MVLPAPLPLPLDAAQIRHPERELARRQGWLNWWTDHGQPRSAAWSRVRRERERLHTILLQRQEHERILSGAEDPIGTGSDGYQAEPPF